ncbi:unnamed protein product [Hymenolepis diminuta]|uniref:Uncharacterized protein n=1 Tax=Hymenolepis diminuta TaxID=6216 RepID=A0A564Z2U6_HYMDI|nr:unnamed protein product [Hymenolepis diminuta]
MVVCRPKRLGLMDNKCEQPRDIVLAKPVYHSKGTQNAGDTRQIFALISSQDPLTCSQTKVSLSHINLIPLGPI